MKKLLLTSALLVSVLAPVSANAALQSLSSLFVFGDSLSDGGNSGLVSQAATGGGVTFPPPPYYNGQYSNGPVAVEYLWNSYNPGDTSFRPSLAGGTNYAIGGATTGASSYNGVNDSVPDPLKPAYSAKSNAWQLGEFAAAKPVFDPATSLFVVWLFPNDVFYSAKTGALPGTVPGSPGGGNVVSNGIANILTTIGTLAAAGAQHFLVPNMPDLGTVPGFAGKPEAPGLTFLTGQFNTNLKLQLDLLDAALASAEIVQFDTEALFKRVTGNRTAYGLEVTDKACVDYLLSGECNPGNWNKWLFWDGVHPTTAGHQILASQFRAAVPEPATLFLLAFGIFGLAASARRQSM
ncbi:SGNH/GDSL hydrolase family protein [Accumulibacter sp.]|uniref:SGNH/GDSL hydrolase family protein n=1 Tax=Accumulibacter sp. TaxID=2053492 RepID=UPI0026269A12|nr:SGNH/GDSL hydrolase family protein [Accumulibacter sp.]